MAEIFVPNGSWAFDGETLRIVPGSGSGVHELRKAIGELEVPLAAIAGVAFEPARRGGHLRLRLRKGADPLTDAVGGSLGAPADPYRLAVPAGRTGAAEYLADEVRDMLRAYPVPSGPSAEFLMPGPAVPVTATAGDGTAVFDGEQVRLEWTLFAKTVKKSAGPQVFALAELAGVEWKPLAGLGYGSLRFRLKDDRPPQPPESDPRCLSWGIQRYGGMTALVAAAVVARLPRHAELPATAKAAPAAVEAAPGAGADGLDAQIRRLGELGELHRAGVLTDEEFERAKRAVLRDMEA